LSSDLYEETYGHQEDFSDEEGERRVRGEPVVQFPYYVVKFEDGKGAFSKVKNTPSARYRVNILHGPAGTIGERVFDDFYLSISPTKSEGEGDRRTDVPKTDKEKSSARKMLSDAQNKVARVLEFDQKAPNGFSQDEIDAYAKQFSKGVTAIVTISYIKASGPYPAKNRIDLLSLARPDDPAHGKKAPAGQTALEEALLKIKEFDARKPASNPTTAGAYAKPTSADAAAGMV